MNRVPFQYTVLHYMHDVTTGEFLNVGLVIYSATARYFQARMLTQYRRVTATFPETDGDFYKRYLGHLQTIADQITLEVSQGQLSLLDDPSGRIEPLLARILTPDDSSIKFGPMHDGVADDLDIVFEHLYSRLVTRHLDNTGRASRNDEDVWNVYRRPLQAENVIQRLQPHVFQTRYDPISLDHSWKNGHWNAVEAVSFDLVQPNSIQRKASQWFGQIHALTTSVDLGKIYLLLGAPKQDSGDLKRAYRNAKSMISDSDQSVELVEENQADEFAKKMRDLVDTH